MAADSWSKCPECMQAFTFAREAAESQHRVRIQKAYGKLSLDKYQEEYNAAGTELGERLLEIHRQEEAFTLREDYQIGITRDGKFVVDYKGRCTHCQFEFVYDISKKVL